MSPVAYVALGDRVVDDRETDGSPSVHEVIKKILQIMTVKRNIVMIITKNPIFQNKKTPEVLICEIVFGHPLCDRVDRRICLTRPHI